MARDAVSSEDLLRRGPSPRPARVVKSADAAISGVRCEDYVKRSTPIDYRTRVVELADFEVIGYRPSPSGVSRLHVA